MSIRPGLDIAVIGISGRFPRARNMKQFWENLKNGVDGITFFTDEELAEAGVDKELLSNPDYVKANCILEGIEYFDAAFFDYTPVEAEVLDPQMRLFLLCAWEALEDAGYDTERYPGLIGVYAGAKTNPTWGIASFLSGKTEILGYFAATQLSNKDSLSPLVSYKLNLKGPSFTLQSACSTSLVAIHLGCQGLLNGECDIAIAGGANINLPQTSGYLYQEGMLYSSDGHCRSFDARADGSIFGNGVGVVVLKRIEDAAADRDNIYVLVKGSAISNDGNRKPGFTAPSADGQKEAIRAALQVAEVDPESIGYVETHGTGTTIGDPIEFEALKQAFNTEKKAYCGIGSVKTNIGHLDAAAGVAGFIKTVLALKYGQIPPSLFFECPNPSLDIINTPFYVNVGLTEWTHGEQPLRAGVSTFGVGGTNAHVVLEQAPPGEKGTDGRKWKLICLSARTETALKKAVENFREHLLEHPSMNLADAAYTLQVGRRGFNRRWMGVCRDLDSAVKLFSNPTPDRVDECKITQKNPPLVFIFPGVDTPSANTGLELYRLEPEFRQQMDHCFDALESITGTHIKDTLYPGAGVEGSGEAIDKAGLSLPAAFMLEYSMAKLLEYWGISPYAVMGRNCGEFVAAAMAGVLSLKDALKLVCLKSRLDLTPDRLERELKNIKLNKPQVPCISAITGERLADRDAVEPGYWAKRVLEGESTGFGRGGRAQLKQEGAVFVNIGCGKEPDAGVENNSDKSSGPQMIHINLSGAYSLVKGVGSLWLYGVEIDWPSFYKGEARYRISLPTYPFEKKRYWLKNLEQGDISQWLKNPDDRSDEFSRPRKRDIDDWFYIPSWKRVGLSRDERGDEGKTCKWFLFMDSCGLGSRLAKVLENRGDTVVIIKRGTAFHTVDDREYTINHRSPEDYQRLFEAFKPLDKNELGVVVHLWSVTGGLQGESEAETFETLQDLGLYSLLYMIKAFEQQKPEGKFRIKVVSDSMQEVTGAEEILPGKSTLLAAVKVIPQEHTDLSCTSIDIVLPEPGSAGEKVLVGQLLEEFKASSIETAAAYRNDYRWIETFEPLRLDETTASVQPLREKGVYLVTGGLGELGLCLAEYLAETVKARLILTSRAPFPRKEEWKEYAGAGADEEEINKKINRLLRMEEMGAEVLVSKADAGDETQMHIVIKTAMEHFGCLNGVIHSAGIVEGTTFNTLKELGKMEFRQQFRSKVYGLYVLEKVLEPVDLDFCLLMSSMSSILGGLGHAPYAAANIFMDAFTLNRRRKNSKPWISVNWETIHIDRKINSDSLPALGKNELFMESPQMVIGFQRILSWGRARRIVYCVGDLEWRINRWIKLETVKAEGNSPDLETSNLLSRPELSTAYVSPSNESETALVRLWQVFLGIETIGIDDDFFELGGDSLKSIMILERIHRQTNARITIADFFKAPTIRGVAVYLREAEKSSFQPVEKTKDKDPGYFPLSPEQRQVYRGTGLYKNNILVYMMEGDIDKERLENTLKKTIQRHEIFRTSFELLDDIPYQRVHEQREFAMEYYEADETGVNHIITGFVRPFDLAGDTLLRAGLIKVSETRHIFLADTHHIVFDQTSQDILLRDFTALFKGDSLPPLQIQYRDFVQWQKNFWESEQGKKQREYWLEELKGAPVLHLPTDDDGSEKISAAADTADFAISGEEFRALLQCAKKEGLTLYMILAALYNVLLAKLSGQEDIIIGVPIRGRRYGDFENVIGLFANTLPLRNYPQKNKTFREFMREVRASMLKTIENQEHGFENYPFNTIMALETNDNIEEIRLPGLKLKPVHFNVPNSSSGFGLQLEIREREQLNCSFLFRTNLFKRETIDEFTVYFKKIISSVTGNPDEKIENIKIIDDYLIPQTRVFDEEVGDFGF